jgi:hypothetical protein
VAKATALRCFVSLAIKYKRGKIKSKTHLFHEDY